MNLPIRTLVIIVEVFMLVVILGISGIIYAVHKIQSQPIGAEVAEDDNVVHVYDAQTGTASPSDPAISGLSKYKDLPLDGDPENAISITYLIEHRSALNGKMITVKGTTVSALLGKAACPLDNPTRDSCARPHIVLAASDDEKRNMDYDVLVHFDPHQVPQPEAVDYPIGQDVAMTVTVASDNTSVILTKSGSAELQSTTP